MDNLLKKNAFRVTIVCLIGGFVGPMFLSPTSIGEYPFWTVFPFTSAYAAVSFGHFAGIEEANAQDRRFMYSNQLFSFLIIALASMAFAFLLTMVGAFISTWIAGIVRL